MKKFLDKNHKRILIINIIILVISSAILVSSTETDSNKITALSLINLNDYTFSVYKEPPVLIAFLVFIMNLVAMALIIVYRSRNIYIKTL